MRALCQWESRSEVGRGRGWRAVDRRAAAAPVVRTRDGGEGRGGAGGGGGGRGAAG